MPVRPLNELCRTKITPSLLSILPQAPRPQRPTRFLAPPTKYVDGEDAMVQEEDPIPDAALPASRANLEHLKVQSLRKYAKTYDHPSVHPQSSKEELLAAVRRHWDACKINEEAVVASLMRLRQRGAY